jgi:hypothetical protein
MVRRTADFKKLETPTVPSFAAKKFWRPTVPAETGV